MNPFIPAVQALFDAAQFTKIPPVHEYSNIPDSHQESTVVPKDHYHDFEPCELPADQMIAIFKSLGRIDMYGWVTYAYHTDFNYADLVLETNELKALFDQLNCQIQVRGLDFKKFTMTTLFGHIVQNLEAHEIQISYIGSGVKKKILGEAYFVKILRLFTKDPLINLDEDTLSELQKKDCDDDYQFIFINQKNKNILKASTREVVNFLQTQVKDARYKEWVQSRSLKHFHVVDSQFSLISWVNKYDVSNSGISKEVDCDLSFVLIPDACFLESELKISLNHFLRDGVIKKLKQSRFICPSGGHYIRNGETISDDGLQGLFDFYTKILHIHDLEKLNKHSFSKLISLISMGRRDYGFGVKYSQQDAKGRKSLSWQIVDRFIKGKTEEITLTNALQISHYLKNHCPGDEKMAIAMASNACLCLSEHVSGKTLNTFYKSILSHPCHQDSFSAFSLIDEGVRLGISFLDVMQIHQCFALLALGVKNPQFQNPMMKVFLTKYEGIPAIKIQEGIKSIFVRFDPIKGYKICLELLSKEEKIDRYLENVFRVYLPKNYFVPSQGSQLSSYVKHMEILLIPLLDEICKQASAKSAFEMILNYNLLAACQTCNPTAADLQTLIKWFPTVHQLSHEEGKQFLEFQLENILAYSAIEPWANLSTKLFGNLHAQENYFSAWIETLASIGDQRPKRLAVDVWNLDRSKINSMHLTRLLMPSNIHLALEVFRDVHLSTWKEVDNCLKLFLEMSLILKEHSPQMIYDFLKSAEPLFENEKLLTCLPPLRKSFDDILIFFINILFNSGYKVYVHSLLCLLTKKKILNASENNLWGSLLRELITHAEIEESLALWDKGKTFQIWQLEDRLCFAEYLLKAESSVSEEEKKRSIDYGTKILNKACKLPQSDLTFEHIKRLVLAIITDDRGVVVAKQVSESYSSYLNHKELLSIQLNAIMEDINASQYLGSAEGILKVLPLMRKDKQAGKHVLEFFFSKVLASHSFFQKGGLLDAICKILASVDFNDLLQKETNKKNVWIFNCLQKTAMSRTPNHFAEMLKAFFDEVLEEDTICKYPIEVEYCIKMLLSCKLKDKSLEPIFKVFNIQLIVFSLSLEEKQTFFDLVQLLGSYESFREIGSQKKAYLEKEALTLLKIPCLAREEVLGFHHLWKEIVANHSKIVLDFDVVERLISHLLQYSQKAFAVHWIIYLARRSLSHSQMKIVCEWSRSLLWSNDKYFHDIFNCFYDVGCKDENGNFIWKLLIDECLEKNQFQLVFDIISRKENIIQQIGRGVEELLKHLMHMPAPIQHAQLTAYVLLISQTEVKNPLYWQDLIKKIALCESPNINGQFVSLFKKKVLYENILKEFPVEKWSCLNDCMPLILKDKDFSPEEWLKDTGLTSFFDGSLEIVKSEFYGRFLKLISEKDEVVSHDKSSFPNFPPESIEELINHGEQHMFIQGCQALQRRFLGEATTADEGNLILALDRSSSIENFKVHKVIVEIGKALDAYLKQPKATLIYDVMETCFKHNHQKIKSKLINLEIQFFSLYRKDVYHFLLNCIKMNSFIPFLKYFFRSPVLEKFLSRAQINELNCNLILGQLKNNPCKTSLHFLYDNFSKFNNAFLKRNALKAFARILFDKDSFISKEKQFWRYLDAFFILWIRQSEKHEKYLHKWEKLPNHLKSEKIFLSLLNSDEQLLKKHLQEPIPRVSDPLIFERIFDFADILFSDSTLMKTNLEKNYILILAVLKPIFNGLVRMGSIGYPSEKETKYFDMMNALTSQYIYLNEFLGGKIDLATMFKVEETAPIAQQSYVMFHFYSCYEWPQGLSLANSKKIEIIRDIFRVLAKASDSRHHKKALDLFIHLRTFYLNDLFEEYFLNFQLLFNKMFGAQLQELVKHFVKDLKACMQNSKYPYSMKANLVENTVFLLVSRSNTHVKGIKLFGKYADILKPQGLLKMQSYFNQLENPSENKKELNILDKKTLCITFLYHALDWPKASLFELSEIEKTEVMKETILLKIKKSDFQGSLRLLINLCKTLSKGSGQNLLDCLALLLNAVKRNEDMDLFINVPEAFYKINQKISIDAFEMIFKYFEKNQFLTKSEMLLKKALGAKVFTGNYSFFYEKMRIFGERVLIDFTANKSPNFVGAFFPLLFIETIHNRGNDFTPDEEILRLVEINYWQKTIGKAFSPESEMIAERKFIEVTNEIEKIKGLVGSPDFERAISLIEYQLLENLVSLAEGGNDKSFRISLASLDYVQEMIALIPLKERNMHGYKLLLNCYEILWKKWESYSSFTQDYQGTKVKFFNAMKSTLIESELYFKKCFQTDSGKSYFAKICLGISYAFLNEGDKLDVSQLNANVDVFYSDFMKLIIDVSGGRRAAHTDREKIPEICVFENHMLEFYDLLDRFLRNFSRITILPGYEIAVLKYFLTFIVKSMAFRKTTEEKLRCHELIKNWLNIFKDRNKLQEGKNLLQNELGVEVILKKGQVKEIKERCA
ncbi:hypothetical protein [Parachlamydia acanthamoebae]|uniref:hypothetical protein n=1 Tax=Parachlamydia acanthamoebae TaxID=83552 RepID=UPI0007514ADE|nr:hypothetical protein [Parachlamydia acanthamoebae]